MVSKTYLLNDKEQTEVWLASQGIPFHVSFLISMHSLISFPGKLDCDTPQSDDNCGDARRSEV